MLCQNTIQLTFFDKKSGMGINQVLLFWPNRKIAPLNFAKQGEVHRDIQ
jgi:hypothetical protein